MKGNPAEKCECGHERSNHKGYQFGCLGTWFFHFQSCPCKEFHAAPKEPSRRSVPACLLRHRAAAKIHEMVNGATHGGENWLPSSQSPIPHPYEDPAMPPLARPENLGIVCQVVNAIVTPNLQVLLAAVLGTVDASIPNKDQNRAVKHLLRKQFDGAFLDIQMRSYPNCNFGSGPGYMLEPNGQAFQVGTIRA